MHIVTSFCLRALTVLNYKLGERPQQSKMHEANNYRGDKTRRILAFGIECPSATAARLQFSGFTFDFHPPNSLASKTK